MSVLRAITNTRGLSSRSKPTLKTVNSEKRNHLIRIEKRYQKIWANAKLFESNAPTIAEIPSGSLSSVDLRAWMPKFFGTMAYPYMNGTLHVGHGFTASKVEFATGYARMQGKRALFPMGFHCTGTAIKACADRLVQEIASFGRRFEGCKDGEIGRDSKLEAVSGPTQTPKTEPGRTFMLQKGKAAAKSIEAKYQFQIMLAQGIPLEEIHRFADPHHWINVFPDIGKNDLTNLGLRIDWRRSFVTTDVNPYYDSFVRWQMNRLRALGKIGFGKRYTVYSPQDEQACLDHDRSQGEGINVQEYTNMKMKVLEWTEASKRVVARAVPKDATVYFVPATLRPETMYGQTGCFVGPNVAYGIFKVSELEYFFLSDRAARNMAFQGISAGWGNVFKVAELQGADVIGALVHAPLSVHTNGVRVLPMENIEVTKGTGVATCVPSDSPDDYTVVMDLAMRYDFYGIKKEWAELEIVPIIETPSYGHLTAPTLVQQMGISSPKHSQKLKEAKQLAYKEGFYRGRMIYGPFKGRSVQDAKKFVKQGLIDEGHAFHYAEPDGLVISRSGDECVAAHLDQWYLNYGTTENGGDGAWCDQVLGHIDGELNTFSSETKHAFQQTLGWLSHWACARSYGLGSRLPWDQQFLVESLSDSTIYPAYYTIAHYLHKDLFGLEPGSGNIAPEQMTDDVWDYVFSRRSDAKTDIPKKTLQSMRREFEYWYPLDLRVSGNDLVQNHLIFFLYIHIAMWRKEFWPRGIRANGHLLLNDEKMSKSTGNFLTLNEALGKFGADATRVAFADAGDGIEDANFRENVANSSVRKLFALHEWCREMINDAHLVDSGEQYLKTQETHQNKNADAIQRVGEKCFWDQLFENELNRLVYETKVHYDRLLFKSALKSGFYDLINARGGYLEATKAMGIGMHHDSVRRYIELQALMLTPVAPHWAESIWLEVLSKQDTIQHALFPQVPTTDPSLVAAQAYIRSTTSNIALAEVSERKSLAKGKAVFYDPTQPKKVTIFCAEAFPAWQDKYVTLVRDTFEKTGIVDIKCIINDIEENDMKQAMPFVIGLKRRLEAGESKDVVFRRKLLFDELVVLKEMVPLLKQTVRCRDVEIVAVKNRGESGTVVDTLERGKALLAFAEGAVAGDPTFFFENLPEAGERLESTTENVRRSQGQMMKA